MKIDNSHERLISPDLISLRQSWRGMRWGSDGWHSPPSPSNQNIFTFKSISERRSLVWGWQSWKSNDACEQIFAIFLTPLATIFCISGSILRTRTCMFWWQCDIVKSLLLSSIFVLSFCFLYLRWCARSVERILSLVGIMGKANLLKITFWLMFDKCW